MSKPRGMFNSYFYTNEITAKKQTSIQEISIRDQKSAGMSFGSVTTLWTQ